MKLFQILTLFAITGCLYKSTEHEYTMKNSVKILWFDNAPKYTYSAKIVVKGKMDCSETISVITRKDGEKDYNIFGSSIELKSNSIKETVFNGDWYGGNFGVAFENGTCTENLKIKVVYYR